MAGTERKSTAAQRPAFHVGGVIVGANETTARVLHGEPVLTRTRKDDGPMIVVVVKYAHRIPDDVKLAGRRAPWRRS